MFDLEKMGTTPTGGADLENMGLSPITRKCKGLSACELESTRWPLPKFLEILLVICMPLQIRISRNFRGNMQVPAETLQNAEAETPGILPAVASQLASVREKTLPQNSHILSKSLIFRVPRRVAGSGTETGTEIFGDDLTSKILCTPHGLCGKFVSVCVWKFPEIFPEICWW